jgi:hypothetical protein
MAFLDSFYQLPSMRTSWESLLLSLSTQEYTQPSQTEPLAGAHITELTCQHAAGRWQNMGRRRLQHRYCTQ